MQLQPLALAVSLVVLSVASAAGPLDDFLNRPEPKYKYADTGARVHTKLGGTVYMLNVTSLEWLDR